MTGTEIEDEILKAILEAQTTRTMIGATIEEIIEKTGIDKPEVLSSLLLLCIKKRVGIKNIPLEGCHLELYCLSEEEYQERIQSYLWDFFFRSS